MLDLNEIDRAIAELEAGQTTLSNCSKLADLYAVRDAARGDDSREMRGYSMARSQEYVGDHGESDFLRLTAGKEQSAAWKIIDGLMDTLKVVNQRVYDRVIERLKAL